MQVLYFLPAFREAMLAHVPSPEKEFSLMGEVALLFRMLFTAQSEACQVCLPKPELLEGKIFLESKSQIELFQIEAFGSETFNLRGKVF